MVTLCSTSLVGGAVEDWLGVVTEFFFSDASNDCYKGHNVVNKGIKYNNNNNNTNIILFINSNNE